MEDTTETETKKAAAEAKEEGETIRRGVGNVWFSIWPPSERTREAVRRRLGETLSKPSSVLCKRYGTIPSEEADESSRRIEEEAYESASALLISKEGEGDDGMEVLQAYSKEISRLMLDSVKSRSPPPPYNVSLHHLNINAEEVHVVGSVLDN